MLSSTLHSCSEQHIASTLLDLGVFKHTSPLSEIPSSAEIEAEFYRLPKPNAKEPSQECYGKCRYSNVIAYEENRYRSPHDTHFWIDASVHPTGFISTMAPLDGHDYRGAEDTRPDFWQMIWEANVHVIVMATDLWQRGRVKSSRYWPNNNATFYGRYQVSFQSEERSKNIVTRKLSLNDGNKSRTLHHVHITFWPDHRPLPDLEDMDIAIAQTEKYQKEGPVVAHCSAGVGRTGTYIACYLLHVAKRCKLQVDIWKLVASLRELGRTRSVQELEQYLMIYSYAERLMGS
ncbi:MAG: protein tyrosine phosphatase family protein [Chlamydiales bacterium]